MPARLTQEEIQRIKDLKAQGYTCWYVAKKCYCSISTVWKHTCEEKRNSWTEEEIKQLMILREEKQMQFKDIAAILGRTNQACRKKHWTLRNSLKTS